MNRNTKKKFYQLQTKKQKKKQKTKKKKKKKNKITAKMCTQIKNVHDPYMVNY